MTRPLSPSAPAISRSEGIAAAGATLAAARQEIHETYLRGGARAVAEAACPGGSEAELEQLAALCESWVREDRARHRKGAAGAS